MPVSRTLNIDVTFHCTHNPDGSFGGSATYAQNSSTPNMGNVVDADGTINLDRAAAFDHSAYTENVDIYFTLAPQAAVTPDNTTTPVEWATQNGVGMHITVPNGGSATEFEVHTIAGQPNKLLVKDKDDDSNVYNYKPAVELTAHGRYFISLDPRIVNRPN